MNIIIKPLEICEIDQVVLLHYKYLNTEFRGKIGQEILKIYYSVISHSQGGCGYVALRDNKVVGYICGLWNSSEVKRYLLSQYFGRMIILVIIHSILNPKWFVSSLFRLLKGRISIIDSENEYELRPIVVIPEERGSGLAISLVDTILTDASNRGYSEIVLLTEENNYTANAFYRKTGFYLHCKINYDNVIYNKFIHVTEKKNEC